MLKRTLLAVTCFAMLFVASGARAGPFDRKTTVTFDQAVELSGTVLPAGTYVFRLVDLPGTRNVVQVLNEDQDHVFTTVIAIPDYAAKPYDEVHFGLGEQPAGKPRAIRHWFYPGDVSGLEFPER